MILCYINLFALNQHVFTTNPDSDKMDMIGKCRMDELPKFLVDSYYSLDSDKIKLLGYKKYIDKIIPEMTEYNLMAKYLITTTETYRVDTEAEATDLINNAKNDTNYVLAKYSTTKRERKQKGEIVDEWYRVSLVKNFNDEKEPDGYIEVHYGVDF